MQTDVPIGGPALPDLPGDRYELVGVLGEGGMATVYSAIDTETAEWCAIKVLHPKFLGKQKVRSRFATEAQAMKRLRHRNVIHVFDVCTDNAHPYFAMELARGGCVVEWLATFGPMPPRMAVDVVIQVCKGLGAAHRQGVIHRDVKPHNILVNRRGVCKITDFGIARLDDDQASLTRTGSVMGTLGYIAPEQRANAKDVDERSDVYSVGATLYTMLTGRTTMDLFFADQEPEMMRGVPEALCPLILKATRYRREERHPSTRALAKELYHVKPELPEDPEDTPSLVMHEASDPTDEISMRFITSDTSVEQTYPTPRPSFLPNALSTADSTTPSSGSSIPRKNLLRSWDESDAPRRLGNKIRTVLLAISPLLVLVSILTGIAASGRTLLHQGQASLEAAEVQIAQVLQTEKSVMSEIIGIGAPEAAVHASWNRHANAPPTQRHGAIVDMIVAYRQLLIDHEPEAGSSRTHLARTATQRLDRIERSVQSYNTISEQYERAMGSPQGRLATTLGLGPPAR